MSCHQRNPATVTFPGGWGSAEWHPPVLSLLQTLLKDSGEANMAAHYVVHTLAASSSLALFSNHGRNRPQLSEQRAVFVFSRDFYFRRVPPCACAGPLMYSTPTFASAALLTELCGPSTKACGEEGRRDARQRRGVFFPSPSLRSSLPLIVVGRCFSFSSALISSRDSELFNFSTQQTWRGPFLTLAQTRRVMVMMFSFFFHLPQLLITRKLCSVKLFFLNLLHSGFRDIST